MVSIHKWAIESSEKGKRKELQLATLHLTILPTRGNKAARAFINYVMLKGGGGGGGGGG